jgi:hypothetical protein
MDLHVTRPDQVSTGLPMLEEALLWTMRAWVIGHSRRVDVEARIDRVFSRLGVPEAGAYLAGFMGVLSRTATRVLEVNCVCHPEVSDDEAALLRVAALQQGEAYEDAYALLAGMTTEVGAAAGCDQACRLALALQDAGQILRREKDIPPGHGGLVSSYPRRPASATLH